MNNQHKSYVYIFGAGSTAAAYPNLSEMQKLDPSYTNTVSGLEVKEGAPLTNELLKLMLEIKEGQYKSHIERLKNYIHQTFQLQSNSNNIGNSDLSIQEILTTLDWELDSLDIIHHDVPNEIRVGKEKELTEIKHNINELISKVLDNRLGRGVDEHTELLSRHLVNKLNEGDELIIINLNYDLVIDNGFLYLCHDESIDNQKIHPYTPFDFNVLVFNKDEYRIIKENEICEQSKIKILKPHGSLNWLFCNKCNKRFVTYEKLGNSFQSCKNVHKRTSKKERFICSICGDSELISKLITPTLIRKLDHFKEIWKETFLAIKNADALRIIGYSLPPEDKEFRSLLRKALNENKKFREKKLSIMVFDGGEKIMPSSEDIKTKKYKEDILFNSETPQNKKYNWYKHILGENLTNSIENNPFSLWIYGFNRWFKKFCNDDNEFLELTDNEKENIYNIF
jgi:hypothetical protein